MALKYLYVPSGYKAGTAYGVLPNDSSADFDNFSRPSGATRVDSNRLIDRGESLGSNIEPTDFSSGWTGVGSGMTLSTGSAEFDNDGSGAYIQTSSNITLGTSYRIIFEVTSFTSAAAGGLYYYSANGGTKLSVEGVGTYEYTFTSNETRTFVLNSYTGTTLTVGSVSLREITTENTNTPRLDYTDGSCPALLLEPQRTNLCLNSTRGVYGNSPASTTQTLAPDGTNTATIPTPNDTADRYEYTISAGSATGDTKITYSWYRKRLSTPSEDPNQTGDLKVSGLVNCIQDGSTIQIGSDIGGYDRFSATFDVVDGSLEAKIRLYFGEVVGIGNSSVAYFGHQVEIGAHATSYIPTDTDSTSTRNLDRGGWAANFDGMNNSEGVLEARFKAFDTDVSNRITLGTNVNGDDHNRLAIGYTISGGVIKPFVIIVYDGGGAEVVEYQTVSMPSSFNIFEYNTYKFKFKAGNNELKINGELVALSNTMANLDFSFGGVLESISLNVFGSSTSNRFYGGIKHIKVYDSITDF